MLARLTTFVPTLVLAALIFYFGFNALTGDRGILTAHRRKATLAEDEAELATLKAEHAELARRAALLRRRPPFRATCWRKGPTSS